MSDDEPDNDQSAQEPMFMDDDDDDDRSAQQPMFMSAQVHPYPLHHEMQGPIMGAPMSATKEDGDEDDWEESDSKSKTSH